MSPAATRNFIFGGIALAILFSIFGYQKLKEQPSGGCLSTVDDSIVVIIDQTGPLSLNTKNTISAELERAVQQAKSATTLAVYNVESSPFDLQPIFKGCIPEKRTALTDLYKNGDKVEKTWRAFLENLKNVTSSAPSVAVKSPIYQTIGNVVRDKSIVRDPKVSTLIVFSDFVEYSDLANLYSCNLTKVDLCSSAISGSITTDPSDRPLNGMLVKRYYIPRGGDSRTKMDCLQSISNMVFNRLGMGANQTLAITPSSPPDVAPPSTIPTTRCQ